MKACSYAKKYKGIYAPKCNDGVGCDACKAIYIRELNKRHGK